MIYILILVLILWFVLVNGMIGNVDFWEIFV